MPYCTLAFLIIKHCSGHAAKETLILALAPHMCIHKHVNLHVAAFNVKKINNVQEIRFSQRGAVDMLLRFNLCVQTACSDTSYCLTEATLPW